MNPPELYTGLRALEVGLSAAIADAADKLREYRRQTRSKGFETDWGTVDFRKNDPKRNYDMPRLLKWAEVNLPHEVIPAHDEVIRVPTEVRPTLWKTLAKRFKVEGDTVVDRETGEVIDFVTLTPAKPDSPVFTMPAEKKTEAVEYVAAQAARVAAVMEPAQVEAWPDEGELTTEHEPGCDLGPTHTGNCSSRFTDWHGGRVEPRAVEA